MDIVTILPWSRGSHNIQYLLYCDAKQLAHMWIVVEVFYVVLVADFPHACQDNSPLAGNVGKDPSEQVYQKARRQTW